MNALAAIVQHRDDPHGTTINLHFRDGAWTATVFGTPFGHLFLNERPRGVGRTPQAALKQLLSQPAWPEGREA